MSGTIRSLPQHILHHALHTPDKTAVIADNGQLTYAQLAQKMQAVCAALQQRGITPGSAVVSVASHCTDYVAVCYGIHLAGAVHVPVENHIPQNRLTEIAAAVDARLIVAPADPQCGIDYATAEALMSTIPEAAINAAEPSDTCAEILYTTGTTGKSKGVMVSYTNQVNIAMAGVETTNIRSDEVWLIPTPMNHAAALRKVHIAMAVGSTSCLLEGFRNFKLYFKTIHDNNVTSLYLPPSAIHLLLAFASKELAALNGQIRFVYSSSTAYPETDKEKMRQLMPDVYMYNAFGCSEAGVVCTDEFCVSGGSQYAGSVGMPNSYSEIVLLDEDGNEMEQATAQNPGLVAIRSKSVMQGYWNEPEQTAKAIKNGMLVMSDLCYFAPNGELILVGRSNDTINLGGLKIAPVEVEDVVRRVDCVDECLLIPVTKGDNTALRLLVVLKEGKELDEAAIRTIISQNLEPYKMPKQIVVIEEIIKTFNGKIDRKQMISKYA